MAQAGAVIRRVALVGKDKSLQDIYWLKIPALPKNWVEHLAWHNHNYRMLAKVCSAALNGIEAYPVEVEVNVGWGDTLIVIIESI